jgi:CheY-like chemotaxis protein
VSASKLVLLVDDDLDVQDLLSSMLCHEGYDVHTASNGAEAIESLQDSPYPDVVVTDLRMPGTSGGELIEYIRRADGLANVSVAVLSGNPEEAPLECKVFRKPVRFADLLRFIRQHTCEPS